MLAGQGSFEPFFHQSLTGPGNRVDTGIQSGRDLAVAQSFAGFRGIRLQQDTVLQQLLRGVFTPTDQIVEPFSLLLAELHDVFLYGDLFPGHESAPSIGCGPSSQRSTVESMT